MPKIAPLIRSILLIVPGILSATFGLKGFLLPNHFIDGGATGISMLLSDMFNIPLSVLIAGVNAPFIIFGYRQISRGFTWRSIIAIAVFAFSLFLFEFPQVTDDKLLAAVFGGFFLGAGIGLSIRGGGVLDGTEVMALIVSKKLHFTIGDVIFAVNVIVFSIAAVYLEPEIAMYSVITYLAASRSVNFLLHGIEEFTGVLIISSRSGEIREAIISGLGRGVTVFKGRGGMTGQDQDILFSVVSRLEIPKIRSVIYEIDQQAFVTMHRVDDTVGGMIKKKIFH